MWSCIDRVITDSFMTVLLTSAFCSTRLLQLDYLLPCVTRCKHLRCLCSPSKPLADNMGLQTETNWKLEYRLNIFRMFCTIHLYMSYFPCVFGHIINGKCDYNHTEAAGFCRSLTESATSLPYSKQNNLSHTQFLNSQCGWWDKFFYEVKFWVKFKPAKETKSTALLQLSRWVGSFLQFMDLKISVIFHANDSTLPLLSWLLFSQCKEIPIWPQTSQRVTPSS